MRSVFVASIIFLFVFFADTVYGKRLPSYGTGTPVGCYAWKGKITCEDGSPILPTATVKFWEEDYVFDKDDFITSAKVNLNGTYSFWACIDDSFAGFETSKAQIYLEFEFACPGVESSYSYPTSPFQYFTYQISKEHTFARVIARSDLIYDIENNI